MGWCLGRLQGREWQSGAGMHEECGDWIVNENVHGLIVERREGGRAD